MTNGQDWDQPGQHPQEGYGQPWPQDQPWQPQQYDPGTHQRRMGGQQYAPQGQPPQAQPPYPPQGQPWPQPGYQPPHGPPGWQQPGYGQQPPYPPQYMPPQPPTPQPPQRKRHTARNVFLLGGTAVLALIVTGVALGSGKTSSTSASATASGTVSSVAGAEAAAQNCTASGGTWNGTSCQAAAPSPSNTPAPPTKVEFIVSGTAPDGIDITYGPSGSQFQGPSTLDGTATMSVPFDGTAEYYAINAQLQGGGSITCKIVATGPGDAPLTVSRGAASGGYNICDAQAAPEDSSGLTWENET